jgi:hypothetical protein
LINHFTIDTPKENIPKAIKQYEIAKLSFDEIINQYNEVDTGTLDKTIECLKLLKEV